MKSHPGFIAALDQSGGSTPKALGLYGIKEDAWSNDEEMFAIVHQMRARIITSPSFNGDRILAAILFENTMDRDIEGQPTADYLWNLKQRRADSKGGQGTCRGTGRCPSDEADARTCRVARQSQREANLRNQNAFGHQASQCNRHPEYCEPTVRGRGADHRRRACADHRTGSRHSLPGQSQGRRDCSKRASRKNSTRCRPISW